MRDRAAQREINEGLQELYNTAIGVDVPAVATEVSKSDSILNLNEGLKRLETVAASATGEFAGIIDGADILTFETREQLINWLLLNGIDQAAAVAGNNLTILSKSDEWGEYEYVYVGSTIVASHAHEESGEEFFVAGKSVLFSEYRDFLAEAKKLTGSAKTDGSELELPADLIEVVKRERAAIQEEGIQKCRNILKQAQGNIVGTFHYDDFYGYSQDSISFTSPVDEVSKQDLFGQLMNGRQLLYDDQHVSISNASGVSSRTIHYIGETIVASSYKGFQDTGCSSYQIFDRPVSREDFQSLIASLEGLGSSTEKRHLSDELKREFERHKMQQTLDSATAVEAGWMELGHIYGGSYFGSGGGYGSLRVYKLSDWREGIKTPVEVETRNGDNGFVSGPNRVNIPKDSIVIARGGDAIGRKGRSWSETYLCMV